MNIRKIVVVFLSVAIVFHTSAVQVFASESNPKKNETKQVEENCTKSDSKKQDGESNQVLASGMSTGMEASLKEDDSMVNIIEVCALIVVVSIFITGIYVTDRHFRQ